MTTEEILSLIREAKALGVAKLSVGDVSFEFSPTELKAAKRVPHPVEPQQQDPLVNHFLSLVSRGADP